MRKSNLKQCIRRALGCKHPDFSNVIEGMADTLWLN